MKKETVAITKNFNKNIEVIANLIVKALEESTSIPQLSADDFNVRVSFSVKEKLNMH